MSSQIFELMLDASLQFFFPLTLFEFQTTTKFCSILGDASRRQGTFNCQAANLLSPKSTVLPSIQVRHVVRFSNVQVLVKFRDDYEFCTGCETVRLNRPDSRVGLRSELGRSGWIRKNLPRRLPTNQADKRRLLAEEFWVNLYYENELTSSSHIIQKISPLKKFPIGAKTCAFFLCFKVSENAYFWLSNRSFLIYVIRGCECHVIPVTTMSSRGKTRCDYGG